MSDVTTFDELDLRPWDDLDGVWADGGAVDNEPADEADEEDA